MKHVKIILGVLISVSCLWLLKKNFVWSDLTAALKTADWRWFFPVMVMYFGSFCLRTLRWQIFLNPVSSIPFSRLFPILTFGFMVNNVMPARMGEFARCYAVSHNTKVPFSSVLGTVVAERLSDLIGLAMVALLALHILDLRALGFLKFLRIIGIGVLFVVAFFFLTNHLTRKSSGQPSLLDRLILLIQKFRTGLYTVKSPKLVLVVILLSVSIWLVETSNVFLLCRAFHIDLNFFQSCALVMGISLGVIIPAAPGYIGTYELFATRTLGLMGVGHAVALPFVLVLHFFQFAFSSLLGLIYLFQRDSMALSFKRKETEPS